MGQSHSQETSAPQQPSPFNSVSNELLAEIFAQIPSVSAKMRLGGVCRRFHQCLQLDQAWRLNTELDVSHTSIQASLSFIKHFPPQITSFKLNLPKPHKQLDELVSALEAQRHKFRLSVLDVRVCGASSALESFLTHQSHPSLKVLHLRSAHSDHLAISLIEQSESLSFVSLNMDAYQDQDYITVLNALHNKPLVGLMLSSSLPLPPFPIHREPLAGVISAARGHSLRLVALFNCLLEGDVADFINDLPPGAARAITHLIFSSLHGFIEPTFLALFANASRRLPNLNTMSFTQVHSTNNVEKLLYAHAITCFLEFPAPDPARLEFRIQRIKRSCLAECVRPSGKNWWNKLHEWTQLEGIQQNQNHWHCTKQKRNATAVITYDKN